MLECEYILLAVVAAVYAVYKIVSWKRNKRAAKETTDWDETDNDGGIQDDTVKRDNDGELPVGLEPGIGLSNIAGAEEKLRKVLYTAFRLGFLKAEDISILSMESVKPVLEDRMTFRAWLSYICSPHTLLVVSLLLFLECFTIVYSLSGLLDIMIQLCIVLLVSIPYITRLNDFGSIRHWSAIYDIIYARYYLRSLDKENLSEKAAEVSLRDYLMAVPAVLFGEEPSALDEKSMKKLESDSLEHYSDILNLALAALGTNEFSFRAKAVLLRLYKQTCI